MCNELEIHAYRIQPKNLLPIMKICLQIGYFVFASKTEWMLLLVGWLVSCLIFFIIFHAESSTYE